MYNTVVVDISAFLENLYIAFELSLKAKRKYSVIEKVKDISGNHAEKLRVITASGFSREIIPVLKCDAYGTGAVEISKACRGVGIKIVSVVGITDALRLKDQGLEILILNTISEDELEDAIKNGFHLTCYTEKQIVDIEKVASRLSKCVYVHLKINTGMNRFGAEKEEIQELNSMIKGSKHLIMESIFSHYHNAYSEDSLYTRKQYLYFQNALLKTDRRVNVHLANSACLIRYPQYVQGASRPGIMLYGSYPEFDMFLKYKGLLKPVVEVRSVVVHIRKVKKGEYVGYGDRWMVKDDTFLALIPFGYGEGFHRNASVNSSVWINGKRYTIFGNVSMDSLSILFDTENEVQVGDEVILFGGSHKGVHTVDEAAHEMGIIAYELLTGINNDVRREYINTL
jgi:alanine racemase|tara:strand:- start:1081 stop:2274 length:1194 start_codon:yes stop_codon:yes gene_type:complete